MVKYQLTLLKVSLLLSAAACSPNEVMFFQQNEGGVEIGKTVFNDELVPTNPSSDDEIATQIEDEVPAIPSSPVANSDSTREPASDSGLPSSPSRGNSASSYFDTDNNRACSGSGSYGLYSGLPQYRLHDPVIALVFTKDAIIYDSLPLSSRAKAAIDSSDTKKIPVASSEKFLDGSLKYSLFHGSVLRVPGITQAELKTLALEAKAKNQHLQVLCYGLDDSGKERLFCSGFVAPDLNARSLAEAKVLPRVNLSTMLYTNTREGCKGDQQELCETSCQRKSDPLVLDINGNGFFMSASKTVKFDINATGAKKRMSWTIAGADSDAFLFRDLNHNGIVDDGSELFSTSTAIRDSQLATNGFNALADLDSNSDGFIDSNDSAFAEIGLWSDLNANGVTDSGETIPLSSLVESISLSFDLLLRSDRPGNMIFGTTHVLFRNSKSWVPALGDLWMLSDP